MMPSAMNLHCFHFFCFLVVVGFRAYGCSFCKQDMGFHISKELAPVHLSATASVLSRGLQSARTQAEWILPTLTTPNRLLLRATVTMMPEFRSRRLVSGAGEHAELLLTNSEVWPWLLLQGFLLWS